jgi:BolA protein
MAPNAVDGDATLAYRKAMQVKSAIVEKLTAAFAPQSLDVADESHRHEGHAGHRPGGQTHFRVQIVSEAFRGKSRIERHRMVNQALAHELASGVHALAIEASAPGEGRS